MGVTTAEPRRLRIEELAQAGHTSVRNVQKYIGLGLLMRPVGKTRNAYYVDSHLSDLLYIRQFLAKDGSLARAAVAMNFRRAQDAAAQQSQATSHSVAPAAGFYRVLTIQEHVVLMVPGDFPMSSHVHETLIAEIRGAVKKARQVMTGSADGSNNAPSAGHQSDTNLLTT